MICIHILKEKKKTTTVFQQVPLQENNFLVFIKLKMQSEIDRFLK